MEDTTFAMPLKPRIKEEKKTSPWNFNQPPYDERTSCYVNAGSHWDTGFRNPVGRIGGPKQRVDTLPYGKHKGMKDTEVPHKNLRVEIDI